MNWVWEILEMPSSGTWCCAVIWRLWHHIPQGCISYCCKKVCAMYLLSLFIVLNYPYQFTLFVFVEHISQMHSETNLEHHEFTVDLVYWPGFHSRNLQRPLNLHHSSLVKETCWFVVCWSVCCPSPFQNWYANIAKTVDYFDMLNTLLWHQTYKTYTKHLILLMTVTWETMLTTPDICFSHFLFCMQI